MRSKNQHQKDSAEKIVREIRRATRRRYSAEEKIRIVLEGLRGEDSIAALCRREGINENLYDRGSKEFLEAGKKRLAGDTAREATSDEVKTLRAESSQLKEALAEILLENRLLKKTCSGMGRTLHEIFRIREAGDHRAGGALFIAGSPNTITAGYPEVDLLWLVQPLCGGRTKSAGGPKADAGTGLEHGT